MKKLLLLILVLSSCLTPSEKVGRVSFKYPSNFRDECARQYPIRTKDSLIVKTIRKTDTVQGPSYTIDCDSVVKAANELIQIKPASRNPGDRNKPTPFTIVRVDCPDTYQYTDSILTLHATVAEDSRMIEYWREQTYEARADWVKYKTRYEDAKKAATTASFVSVLFIILTLLFGYLYLKK